MFSRVKSVRATKLFTLNIEWQDGSRSTVDMTRLVRKSRHFRLFDSDVAAFRKVKPDKFGNGIEWKNGLDYSAASLRALSQRSTANAVRHTIRRR